MAERKTFNKLVRDKIPQLLKEKSCSPETRVLGEKEYKICLFEKLKEECEEVICAQGKSHLAEELADVLEVISSIAKHSEITMPEIEKIRIAKKEKRGGFGHGIFLISTETAEKI